MTLWEKHPVTRRKLHFTGNDKLLCAMTRLFLNLESYKKLIAHQTDFLIKPIDQVHSMMDAAQALAPVFFWLQTDKCSEVRGFSGPTRCSTTETPTIWPVNQFTKWFHRRFETFQTGNGSLKGSTLWTTIISCLVMYLSTTPSHLTEPSDSDPEAKTTPHKLNTCDGTCQSELRAAF